MRPARMQIAAEHATKQQTATAKKRWAARASSLFDVPLRRPSIGSAALCMLWLGCRRPKQSTTTAPTR